MADIVTMPKLGFDMAEGTLVRWVIGEGEKVVKGAVLAEIETDKATVEVESNFDGIVLRHLVPQGEVVPVNTPIAVVGQPGEQVDVPEERVKVAVPAAGEGKPTAAGAAATAAPEMDRAEVESAQVDTSLPSGLRASPLARRMAEEHKLDLAAVRGTGPQGRIVKRDVEKYLASPPPATVAPSAQTIPVSPPVFSPAASPGVERRIPLTRLRGIIARRMVEAVQQAPHFFVTHEYDMEAVMGLRKQLNDLLPEDEKLSVNDFIVRAAALALHEFPNLNASIDLSKDEIIQHGQVNIGAAVALDSGLLTIVCRDADRKSLRQISLELRTMVNRAREGKVKPDDIEGSTFTVSNLGMFDVEHFTAIINPPEAAILAVGSARQVPVVVDGEIRPGTRMRATLSVDHRVSDGAEGAQFLQALAGYLEQPLKLLI
ncbi:MAG: 2-oxo acid dehydrogenase subunit E2 [Anaerolineales bacterium]|nr:2-oxo acid dehydrogenase subunit E2 [Anaerolineales bacterium]